MRRDDLIFQVTGYGRGATARDAVWTMVIKYGIGMLLVWGIVSILGVVVGFWGILLLTLLFFLLAAMADV